MSTHKDSWSAFSSIPTWKYDVFLSFRGKDTRNGFVSHLYAALKLKGISTFKDDVRLEKGKPISSDLSEAIEQSRFAIVIFSRNYASSRWCLDELTKIVECKKETRIIVLPVFYKVDPSDVRNQRNSFGQAFDKHEIRFKQNLNKLQMWKDALREVADTSGWHLQNSRPEAEFIQDIVEMIFHKLNFTFSIDTKGLIGMKSQVDDLMSHLAIGLDDIRMIGIRGMGGIGKTTLARVVYSIVSNKFDACSFISNIREDSKEFGLLRLQQELLHELLMERPLNIHNVDNGVFVIKKRLRHKRILLVLDDVTDLDQLNKLAGKCDWFGRGSRVIITTRDERLLLKHEVDIIYEPMELIYDDAMHLFSLNAFKEDHPATGFLTLSQKFVQYANGLPLAIEVLGSFLFTRSIEEWESALGRLKDYPERNILDVLQISFDGLHQTEKEIFLHIACFFNHEDKNLVVEILDCLDLYPIIGLGVLFNKSLLKLNGNKLWMHDLLQEMGRDMVREECRKEPGKRSRIWLYTDIDNELTKNMEKEAIEGIVLKLLEPKEVYWHCEAFSKMCNLKLLVIHNVHLFHDPQKLSNGLRFLDWRGYPSKIFPSHLLPDELVGLHMCYSNIERFWKGTKYYDKLRFINLSESQKLIETPDFTKVPNLEKLVLEGCLNLCSVHPSIGAHKKLTLVNLRGCKSIRSLPDKFEMESLEILILSGCSKVDRIPEFMGNIKCVSQFYSDGTSNTELPTSIGQLTSLTSLSLRDCKNLKSIPSTIFNLKSLIEVNISGCSKLSKLPDNMGNAERLEELDISGTSIRDLPLSISLLKNLRVLVLGATSIRQLPSSNLAKRIEELDISGTSIRQLTSLRFEILKLPNFSTSMFPSKSRLDKISTRMLLQLSKSWLNKVTTSMLLSSLKSWLGKLNLEYCNLMAIPNDIGCLFSLKYLKLSGNHFAYLPESIVQLSKLEYMELNDCTSLRSLPKLPLNVYEILAHGCTSLQMLSDQLKPNDSFEPSLFLCNCLKLANNQRCINILFAVIKKYLQGLSLQYPRFLSNCNLVIPGSKISKWFCHQSMGAELNIKEPSHLCNEWMGISVCVLFFSNHKIHKNSIISCFLMANGENTSIMSSIANIPKVLSDHLWLVYLFPQFCDKNSLKLLWECDASGFSKIGIRIKTLGQGLEVKQCGFRMVYKKDIEDLNQTMVQCGNNNIAPYEGLDVLHHNFDNPVIVAEGKKVKRSRGDYDEAGPSGEGSSNDVPYPKRIERLQEIMAHGESDYEGSRIERFTEYVTHWDESSGSESDLDG